jgi:16S rRNA (uracil1498-N3)-methyltransferase
MRVLIRREGCPPGGWVAGQRVSLDPEEMHHLRVRRARNGDAVEILDGGGLKGAARLVQAGKQWVVELQSVDNDERPAELTLAVAAGDRERFAWLVEKAAEFGVTRIVPLETARTVGVATRLKETHLPKLRRSALEATKQSGARRLPRWLTRARLPWSLVPRVASRGRNAVHSLGPDTCRWC